MTFRVPKRRETASSSPIKREKATDRLINKPSHGMSEAMAHQRSDTQPYKFVHSAG